MIAEIPRSYVKNRSGGYSLRRSYEGEANPFYDKHHSEDTKVLLSKPRTPFIRTEEHNKNISLALKGKKHSAEHVQHNRLAHIGQRHTSEWKEEHSKQLKGRKIGPFSERHKQSLRKPKRFVPPFSDEHRRKIGEANRRRWRRPGFAEQVLRKIRSATKPTQPEKYLRELLNDYFPNQWQYVGDGKVIIERKNPDFINCNGKKLIIELFGDYWHDVSEATTKPQFYLKYGFGCLVIWEHELKEPEKIVQKVKVFSNA